MFKVNNKDTRVLPLTLFWVLYCLLWTYFTSYYSIFIVNFEHVIAAWIAIIRFFPNISGFCPILGTIPWILTVLRLWYLRSKFILQRFIKASSKKNKLYGLFEETVYFFTFYSLLFTSVTKVMFSPWEYFLNSTPICSPDSLVSLLNWCLWEEATPVTLYLTHSWNLSSKNLLRTSLTTVCNVTIDNFVFDENN